MHFCCLLFPTQAAGRREGAPLSPFYQGDVGLCRIQGSANSHNRNLPPVAPRAGLNLAHHILQRNCITLRTEAIISLKPDSSLTMTSGLLIVMKL